MSGLRAHDLSGKLRPFGRCPGRAGRKPDRVFGTLKFTDVLGRWNAAELLAVGETDLSPLVSALRGRRRGRPAGPSDRQGVRSASLANASLAKDNCVSLLNRKLQIPESPLHPATRSSVNRQIGACTGDLMPMGTPLLGGQSKNGRPHDLSPKPAKLICARQFVWYQALFNSWL